MKRAYGQISALAFAVVISIVFVTLPTTAISQGKAASTGVTIIPQPPLIPGPPGDPNVRGTISGIAKSPNSSPGIQGVQVILIGMPDDLAVAGTVRKATTDDTGRYLFLNIPGGRYVVECYRDGYFPWSNDVPVAVTQDSPNPQATLLLIAGGSISGTLRDAQGRPAANIPVVPLFVSYWDGKRVHQGREGNPKMTDDRGEYRLSGLFPADYVISTNDGIGAPGYKLTSAPKVPQLTYYPGTRDFSAAIPVVLHSGEEVTGIDFIVELSPSFSVSGTVRVLLPGGKTNANGRLSGSLSYVTVLPENAQSNESTMASNVKRTSDPDQPLFDFELHGIPPGSYTLIPTFYPGQGEGYKTNIPVTVTNHDVVDLRGEIHIYPDVTFHFGQKDPAAANSSPLKNMPGANLHLTALDGILQVGVDKQAGPDGSIVVSNVFPGKYKIKPDIPEGFYLADIRQGSMSLYSENILTVTGDSAVPVEIILSTGGGEVHGTVRDGLGLPAAGFVSLVPSAPLRGNSSLYKTAYAPAKDGRFTFKAIAPGEYKIFAWENVSRSREGAEENAEYLARYESRGKSVIVSAGINASDIAVELIPDDQR